MYEYTKQANARTYNAVILPHLEFCAPVWIPQGMSDQTNLDKEQKRAVRRICASWDCSGFQWSKSYDICCTELGWLTVLDHHCLFFVFSGL